MSKPDVDIRKPSNHNLHPPFRKSNMNRISTSAIQPPELDVNIRIGQFQRKIDFTDRSLQKQVENNYLYMERLHRQSIQSIND